MTRATMCRILVGLSPRTRRGTRPDRPHPVCPGAPRAAFGNFIDAMRTVTGILAGRTVATRTGDCPPASTGVLPQVDVEGARATP